MMNRIVRLATFLLLCFSNQVSAQDTLPKFSLKNSGGKIIVSWTNNFQLVKQISIQRSADSLKNYKTILSVPDPMNKQNGYVDTKAPVQNMFYRLFIVLDGSSFMFSNARRPVIDSSDTQVPTAQKKSLDPFSVDVNRPVKNIDSTLKSSGLDPKNRPVIWVPSIYLFTAKDGNVHLNLPETDTKHYSVKIFDENDNQLFEIKDLKESTLIIDKTNFFHTGWFKFELYYDDKLKEKNKFYISKDL